MTTVTTKRCAHVLVTVVCRIVAHALGTAATSGGQHLGPSFLKGLWLQLNSFPPKVRHNLSQVHKNMVQELLRTRATSSLYSSLRAVAFIFAATVRVQLGVLVN